MRIPGTRIPPVLFCVALLQTAALGGCTLFKRMVGADTVMLDELEVRSMSVDIRKERKTICPLEPVQMAIFVTVEDPEDPSATIDYETWQGPPGTRRNDKLDFADFAFHSSLGSFDEAGFFHPAGGVLASVAREYEIKVVLKKRPDRFTFDTAYQPDYRCVRGESFAGEPGVSGAAGSRGRDGASGAYGGEEPGGDGGDGCRGGDGGDGGTGRNGDDVELLATRVRTPFYDDLLAVIVRSSRGESFLLAHPDRTLVFSADGGRGGAGGSGGAGGRGGAGGSGKPDGDGGNGGNGGNGGPGGDGGTIELVFDRRFPGLESRIRLSAQGGAGGAGGSAGYGGAGGSGGADGQRGRDGEDGTAGQPGPPGSRGRVFAEPGEVADSFAGIAGLEAL